MHTLPLYCLSHTSCFCLGHASHAIVFVDNGPPVDGDCEFDLPYRELRCWGCALVALLVTSTITQSSAATRSSPRYNVQAITLQMHTRDYRILFKKFASLIPFRLLSRILFVSSSLASTAFRAPCKLPSPAGRSILCSYSGIFGARASGFSSCCFRKAFAARCRCFFDFAVSSDQRYSSSWSLCGAGVRCTYRIGHPH